MKRTPFLFLLLLVLVLSGNLRADTLELKDGRTFEGKLTKKTATVVAIETTYGTFEFKRSEVASITEGKSPKELYGEKWKAAKTAQDFYELGVWAKEKRMARNAKKCMKRAIELDPAHAEAQRWLGNVEYKGEWMSPKEREERRAADKAAEMAKQGLVEHEGRWVTPVEKRRLEKGLVEYEGEWMTFEELQGRKGLILFEGAWIPKALSKTRRAVAAVEEAAGVSFVEGFCDHGIVVGPPAAEGHVAEIVAGLPRGRAWFDRTFQLEPGDWLFRGELPEFYLFVEDEPFGKSLPHFERLGKYLPPKWSEMVKEQTGFYWWDPVPTSVVRRAHRSVDHLVGHSYHHWGHLMTNSLNYAGTLLPPWFDEGLASLIELRTHGVNEVFCIGEDFPPTEGGTVAKSRKLRVTIAKDVRAGRFRDAVQRGLEDQTVISFDKLCALEFNQLSLLDIAASMTIVEWLESQEGALPRFHAALRESQPKAPTRVITEARERLAAYDTAFQAACGLPWRGADQAWREWASAR